MVEWRLFGNRYVRLGSNPAIRVAQSTTKISRAIREVEFAVNCGRLFRGSNWTLLFRWFAFRPAQAATPGRFATIQHVKMAAQFVAFRALQPGLSVHHLIFSWQIMSTA